MSVGTVIDSGRYLDMTIPTIKHNNLNSYTKIPTSKSCSYGDLRNQHRQLRPNNVLIPLEIHEEKEPGGIEEIVNTTIQYEIDCNPSKYSEFSLSSL